MSRIVPSNVDETPVSLEELIPMYALNKKELESYKKLCDEENAVIKEQMEKLGEDEYTAGSYIAKRSVSTRETMNEDKLMEIIKRNLNTSLGLIKTKEYVDMDVLEDAIYKGLIPENVLIEMSNCKDVKEVVTLRVTHKKNKKEE